MEIADWSRESTFIRFYLRDLDVPMLRKYLYITCYVLKMGQIISRRVAEWDCIKINLLVNVYSKCGIYGVGCY